MTITVVVFVFAPLKLVSQRAKLVIAITIGTLQAVLELILDPAPTHTHARTHTNQLR
jgi:hypothetical protein